MTEKEFFNNLLIRTGTFLLSCMRKTPQAHYLSEQKAEIAIVEGKG